MVIVRALVNFVVFWSLGVFCIELDEFHLHFHAGESTVWLEPTLLWSTVVGEFAFKPLVGGGVTGGPRVIIHSIPILNSEGRRREFSTITFLSFV